MTWHCRTEGPWYRRLRMALFGLTAKEHAENIEAFGEMQRRVREETELEDADDELRVIQNFTDQQVEELNREMADIARAEDRWRRLQERFAEDAWRIWPLYRT